MITLQQQIAEKLEIDLERTVRKLSNCELTDEQKEDLHAHRLELEELLDELGYSVIYQ